MTLTDQIDDLARRHGTAHPEYGFTRAGLLNLLAEVTAEVRKRDEALIRQMMEALSTAFDQTCSVGRAKDWAQFKAAITAARARLESATQQPTDAERLDWLEAQINKHGAIHLHDGSNPSGHGLGLRPGRAVRTLRQAIDSARLGEQEQT